MTRASILNQVEIQTVKYDRETGKTSPGKVIYVTIEIDVDAVAKYMHGRGRKTLAHGHIILHKAGNK